MIVTIQEPYAEAVINIADLKKDLKFFNIEEGIYNNTHIRYNNNDISNEMLKKMIYCFLDWGSLIEGIKDSYFQKHIKIKFSIAKIEGFKVYKPKNLDVNYKFEFDEFDGPLEAPFLSQDLIKNINYDIKNMLGKVVYMYTTEKGEIIKWR
jgi:hypothetical protein